MLDCAEAADETTWGLTWLELLEERGVKVEGAVTDGARGSRAGLREAQGMGASPDHWHTLRDLGRIGRSLEKEAYQRLETPERARSEAEALRHQLRHGRRPKPGRPKQVATDPSSMQAAKSAAEEAVARCDQPHYVLEVVREVLHPVDVRTGRVRTSREVGAELEAASCLLKELGGGARRAAKLLEERAGDLVSYLWTDCKPRSPSSSSSVESF